MNSNVTVTLLNRCPIFVCRSARGRCGIILHLKFSPAAVTLLKGTDMSGTANREQSDKRRFPARVILCRGRGKSRSKYCQRIHLQQLRDSAPWDSPGG